MPEQGKFYAESEFLDTLIKIHRRSIEDSTLSLTTRHGETLPFHHADWPLDHGHLDSLGPHGITCTERHPCDLPPDFGPTGELVRWTARLPRFLYQVE